MVISRRQWVIGLAASAVAVPLAGCTSGPAAAPSNNTNAPSSDPSGQAAAAAAAAALVRAGAVLPSAIASAPIKDGNLTGGTFIVYSVTTVGASTLLQFGLDYSGAPASGPVEITHEWEPVIVAGEQTIRPTAWYDGEMYLDPMFAIGLTSLIVQASSPAPISMVASYPALPADATQVEVTSPAFGSLTVPVNRTPDRPAGSPELPILGRVVTQPLGNPEVRTPLIMAVHAVRRVPNATAVYYSLAFPEGTNPVPGTRKWYGNDKMLSTILRTWEFSETFGVVDRTSMTGYAQLIVKSDPGKPNGLRSQDDALDDGLAKGNAMAGIAILPPLPPTSTRVDVLMGGQQLIQDVLVEDGALTAPGGPTETVLGNGWPSYNADTLATVTDKQTREALFIMFERVKVDSVTTGQNRLDLDSDVLFEYNKATLTPKADRVIAKAVSLITASGKTGKLQIVGYTDNTGSPATNQELSLRRAKAVAARLQSALTTGYTFETIGRGEADPVASNKTNAGRALNRRVEIILP